MNLNIEVGKYYKTRAGQKVRIYAADGDYQYPIHGAFYNGEGEWVCESWKKSGHVDSWSSDSPRDIVAEWREPLKIAGWVNVYDCDGRIILGDILETRQAADAVDYARLACIRVTGEEEI